MIVPGWFVAPLGNRKNPNFKQIIQSLGLTTNLQCCLDVGDSTSYSGTGQTWSDLQSTNNFFRGNNSTSESSDPTFNGLAGNLSSNEYWSFDGVDWFTQTAGHTFAHTWHKDGAVFTLCAFVFVPSGGMDSVIFATCDDNTNAIGVMIGIQSQDRVYLKVRRGGGSGQTWTTASVGVSRNAWNFVGVSISENLANNQLLFRVNNGSETIANVEYQSPSESNPSSGYKIAADGVNAKAFANASRLAVFGAWNGTRISLSNMASIETEIKKRFA